MKRPWQVWLLFAACVIAALAGMAWLTRQAVKADERRRVAEAEAELEQRISLALWRMDTELAPIIAAEVIRPASEFRPAGKVAVDAPPYVLLQFEVSPDGKWSSPQVPIAQKTASPKLAQLSTNIAYQWLLTELPNTPLPSAADVARNQSGVTSGPDSEQIIGHENSSEVVTGIGPKSGTAVIGQARQQDVTAQPTGQPQQVAANASNNGPAADFQQRGKRYQDATLQNLSNLNRGITENGNTWGPGMYNPSGHAWPASREQVGVSRPIWISDRLLLARRVTIASKTFVQGAWLDWPQLKLRLLGEASDLLPKAELVPVKAGGADDPSRMLAGLPVRLVANEPVEAGAVSPTLRWALTIGWGAVLLAVAAAAFLLQGVMTLSERRAAFVSSVTHELRTPLTTFRMYAEMLAKGMVPDANRRQEYFNTLHSEAERLTLLVENVLSYARLERGRKPTAQDRVTLARLLDRVAPRLKQRAVQAGMQCELNIDAVGANQEFTTDQAVVEQILFNLVDNAAKYAREAADRRIHVEAGRDGQFARLTVRDHGPGIKKGLWSRPMQPFGKSAQESAESAPGVGLGLALCRRLARQLGGRLEVDDTLGKGAKVTLLLPTS